MGLRSIITPISALIQREAKADLLLLKGEFSGQSLRCRHLNLNTIDGGIAG